MALNDEGENIALKGMPKYEDPIGFIFNASKMERKIPIFSNTVSPELSNTVL